MRNISSGKWLGIVAIVVGLAWVRFLTIELTNALLAGESGVGKYVVLMGSFLIVVDRAAPNDQYEFHNILFSGGRTFEFTVTNDDAVLTVIPRPIPVKANGGS